MGTRKERGDWFIQLVAYSVLYTLILHALSRGAWGQENLVIILTELIE